MADQTTPGLSHASIALEVGEGENNPVFRSLVEAFPGSAILSGSMFGQDWAIVPSGSLLEICTWLRDSKDADFRMLLDVTAVDLLPRAPRWEIVYSLVSLRRNDRYRLKVELPESDLPALPSVTSIWPSANFYEREIYDLMGISFESHPDLRRILLPDDWVGYPLRHDHPLGGEEVSFTS